MSITGEILHLNNTTFGRVHDFNLFQSTHCDLVKAKSILSDSAYQGMAKLYPQAQTPIKSSKNHQLNKEEKAFNHHLSSQRIQVENTLAKFKTFKVLSCCYRNYRKRLGRCLNLIAGIINRELGV